MKLLAKIKHRIKKRLPPAQYFKRGDKVQAKTGAIGKVERVFVDKVTNEPRMLLVTWQTEAPPYPILLPAISKRRGFNPFIRHYTAGKKEKLLKRIIRACIRYLSRYLEP